jgi:hypothetical protein
MKGRLIRSIRDLPGSFFDRLFPGAEIIFMRNLPDDENNQECKKSDEQLVVDVESAHQLISLA